MINGEKVSEVKTEILNASMHVELDGKKAREQEKCKKMRAARLSIELYREQQELRHQIEEFPFDE
ncbi:PA3496 family putative envelope integrity protein [Litoribrevibacter euphylliae]|uniref:PA3496 family putative envelope integrity protein n=1 Tax=Litoribrevibacter euphylliae TaxID=1834034 RepID=A0ABV7HMS7_9GAMM